MPDVQRLKDRIATLRERWSAFAETKGGKRLLRALRVVVTAAIIIYLVLRLSQIGWARLWTALPTTPWFYVIFLGMYLTLPTFQALIFGRIWEMPPRKTFAAMLKKRVYDKDVMSYSGDVYVYFWARRRLSLPDRRILHDIKDNAIVSSLVSTLLAAGLLVIFLFSGLVELPVSMREHSVLYVLGGLLAGGGLVGGILRFRESILKLTGQVLLAVAGLHLARLLVVQGLQVLAWSVVVPEVPLQAWLTFLAVQIIITRIPLLPSRDLIFVGAGIELAAAVGVPTAVVAGMLLVQSVLDKALNLLLFAVLGIRGRSGGALRQSEELPASPHRPEASASECQSSVPVNP